MPLCVHYICTAHYSDVMIGAMASQTTGVSIVYAIVCSDADQRKHQSSASLALVGGNHQLPMNSPHKGPVTRRIFPFDNVIMILSFSTLFKFSKSVELIPQEVVQWKWLLMNELYINFRAEWCRKSFNRCIIPTTRDILWDIFIIYENTMSNHQLLILRNWILKHVHFRIH